MFNLLQGWELVLGNFFTSYVVHLYCICPKYLRFSWLFLTFYFLSSKISKSFKKSQETVRYVHSIWSWFRVTQVYMYVQYTWIAPITSLITCRPTNLRRNNEIILTNVAQYNLTLQIRFFLLLFRDMHILQSYIQNKYVIYM